jgi:broad specificity phosphatase PhoE
MINRIIEKPFYFVRHGETDWNKQRIYQGSSDVPLNDTGIGQARSIAALLKKESIAHIVASPLLRGQKRQQK